MIGQKVSQYKILEKLGEGGMGVVYKAQDTKLDRLVALKFLPHHLTTSEQEQSRLMQEAKSAAALNHPNVCSVIDLQEVDGQQFIIMEYVDGEMLSRKVPIKKLEEALGYAIQIGEALQEAHSKGIVHRDIKAENIMVNSRNQVKVMDFGLAKLKGSLKLTRTSSTVGTLAYMSPEQIEGRDADARSDVFSFGVVLFEMITGHGPFRGEHEAAMMYSIINETPEPLQNSRPEISPDIDHIVRRALEKDPEDRYQSAADMVSELRRAQKQTARVVSRVDLRAVPARKGNSMVSRLTGRKLWISIAGVVVLAGVSTLFFLRGGLTHQADNGTGRKKLVVLPFENQGSADQEYFADGITEEITSRLSGLSGLAVIAHSSAMTYKKTTKPVRQIGEELGVSYILQGTIRWENINGVQHTRVTPQLVNVSDGTQVWSEPFESAVSGAFKLQSEIAGNVAQALDVALLRPERHSLDATLTTNSEAYDSYLRALDQIKRGFDERDMRIAEQFLNRAVTLDPNFASAHAELSQVHSTLYWEYYDHTDDRVMKSKEAAEKALRLDPSLASAHVALGLYYYHGLLDYQNALTELNKVLALQPSNSDALMAMGAVERRQGKFEDAARHLVMADEINPRSGALKSEVAVTYAWLRRFADAERYTEAAISLSPDWSETYFDKAAISLGWTGNVSQARSAIEEADSRKVGSQDPRFTYEALQVDIVDGQYQRALDRLSHFQSSSFDIQELFVPAQLVRAQIYGYMNNKKQERESYDAARVILERAVRERPDDARLHSSLGVAYAGLGRHQDAVREGEKAVGILPMSMEAMRGTLRAIDLARIYAIVGQQDSAIIWLDKVLSVPAPISVPIIRIDPAWKSLHGNPRFQKLVAEGK